MTLINKQRSAEKDLLEYSRLDMLRLRGIGIKQERAMTIYKRDLLKSLERMKGYLSEPEKYA